MELQLVGTHEAAYRRRTGRAMRVFYAGAVVVTLIAYKVNIPLMQAGNLPEHLGWGFVLLGPPTIFALIIGISHWTVRRDLLRYRERDAAEVAR